MSKRRGSRAELKTIRLLEASGYSCLKSGGSLGLFDTVAIGAVDVRCVQVKSGTARLSAVERVTIQALPVPANVTRDDWRWPDYARAPIIEKL